MNLYSTADFYGQDIDRVIQQSTQQVARFAQSPFADQPIMTQADHIRRQALGMLAYRKPAAGLALLREYVVGADRFDDAFKAYIDRWAYKHPQPSDFFRTIESIAGEDLDWFWRGWFYETEGADPAVMEVNAEAATATIAQETDLMLPIPVELTFDDGSTQTVRVPTEAFATGDTHTISWGEERAIDHITIDPQQMLPDIDRSNNAWTQGE
jgi:aminopeptidase N